MSSEMRTLLEGLLKREVEDRLGCQGNGFVQVIQGGPKKPDLFER